MESIAEMCTRYLVAQQWEKFTEDELRKVRRDFYAGFEAAFCLGRMKLQFQKVYEDELDQFKRDVLEGRA